MTLPRALSPVEELDCYWDHPDEPNTVRLDATIAGRLDADRLRAAVADTVAGHPIARARRAPWHGWQRRFRWQPEETAECPLWILRWRTEAELAALRAGWTNQSPPLDTGPLLRVGHAIGPEHDVLMLAAHHAAFDGMSCVQLLRTLARRYAGAPRPPAEPANTNGHHGPAGPPPPAPRGPAVRIAADRARPAPGYGIRALRLTCRAAEPRPAATINDVLLTALFLTVNEWNRRHDRPVAPIRVTMPINTRPPDHPNDSLGNFSRLTSVRGGPTDPAELLRSVSAQTSALRTRPAGQLDAATRLLATPLLPVAVKAGAVRLARATLAGRGADTTMLSNLGVLAEPPDFGPDARLAELLFSPVAQLPRGLAVGAATVRGTLLLGFRYRYALLGDAAADRFVATYADALHRIGDPRLVVAARS